MHTLSRLVLIIGVGNLLGILLWILLHLILFLSLKLDSSGGFLAIPSSNGDIVAFIKAGLIIGAIHGFLIAAGVCFSKPNALLTGMLLGVLAVECGLAVAIILGFLYSPDLYNLYQSASAQIANGMVWFLIGSVMLIIPTILIGFLTAKVNQRTG